MQQLQRIHRLVAILLLGFASGLPLALTGQAMQAWLTTDGVAIATIGFLALVGMPYTFKFLWAPLMDRFELPLFGRRRGWLVLTQLILAASIYYLSTVSFKSNPGVFAAVALLIAFLSASQRFCQRRTDSRRVADVRARLALSESERADDVHRASRYGTLYE